MKDREHDPTLRELLAVSEDMEKLTDGPSRALAGGKARRPGGAVIRSSSADREEFNRRMVEFNRLP